MYSDWLPEEEIDVLGTNETCERLAAEVGAELFSAFPGPAITVEFRSSLVD